jgi:hypothetical protein
MVQRRRGKTGETKARNLAEGFRAFLFGGVVWSTVNPGDHFVIASRAPENALLLPVIIDLSTIYGGVKKTLQNPYKRFATRPCGGGVFLQTSQL